MALATMRFRAASGLGSMGHPRFAIASMKVSAMAVVPNTPLRLRIRAVASEIGLSWTPPKHWAMIVPYDRQQRHLARREASREDTW